MLAHRKFEKLLGVFLFIGLLVTLYLYRPRSPITCYLPSFSLHSHVDLYLNREMIFIVGAQSSGTTLMRLILDVHPDINCGDETGIVHMVLKLVTNDYLNSSFYIKFMSDFGVSNQTVSEATAMFIYYMMENNKKNLEFDVTKAKYLCNKGTKNIL